MQPSNLKTIKAKVERLLSNTLSSSVRLSNGRTIANRSHIYRFTVVDDLPNLTKSIIVKHTRDMQRHTCTASGYPSQSWLLFNDWAGLQFMQQVFPDNILTPHFYAGDREQGIIISEDIRPNKSFTPFLQGRDSLAAENALLRFSASLGTMHASTIGMQQAFDTLRDKLAPRVETWMGSSLATPRN